MRLRRKERYVDVRDFGAVGDGKHDDSKAFQAANNYVNRLNEKSHKGIWRFFKRAAYLYVPKGNFDVRNLRFSKIKVRGKK